jgi:hypothetical protein
MDPMSNNATHGTEGSRRDSFTDEHQTLGLPVRRKQTEATKMRKKDMERQGKTPGEKRCMYPFILSHQEPPPNRSENQQMRHNGGIFDPSQVHASDKA